MVRSLHLVSTLLITLLCIVPTILKSQDGESIEQLIYKLSQAERNKLLEILLINQVAPTEETLKSVFKNVGPEKQSEIRDYITLIKSPEYQPSAEVEFSIDTIDFGRVKIGSVLRKTVQFNVLGDNAYIIKGYKSSCPHLKIDMPESEYPFMPEQSGEFILTLDTRKLTDTQARLVVSIRGNNAPYHRKLIYVKADLFSSIDYSGKELKP